MAACPRDLLGAEDSPHRATGGWYDGRQVLGARASAHNGERLTGVVLKSDVVFHADHSCAERPVTRPRRPLKDSVTTTG
jgi:hypothetical protein